MSGDGWSWDPTLYGGSAAFYPRGRVPYPATMTTVLAAELGLDGTGRLLDVGCGPGSLTLLLAEHVGEAIGLDADAAMLDEAARQAARAGVRNVAWRHLRAEMLPADLPTPDLVTFAQSFHWTDRPRVAATVRSMLAPGGAVVHVGATTHRGVDGDDPLPHPRPPHSAIDALVRRHLGEVRRAGRSVLPGGTADGEDEVFRAAGFRGPTRLHLPGRTVDRTAEEVRAAVYSLSSSAPHLFGDGLDAFDAELRVLLADAAPDALFSEQLREITVSVWR